MTRHAPYPGVKRKYSGETLSTGSNLPFEDTPVGHGAKHGRMYASYTGAQLAAGHAMRDAGKAYLQRQEPALSRPVHRAPATTAPREKAPVATPAAPLASRENSAFEIIRPFAEGQEKFLAALEGLRETIKKTLLLEHNTTSKAISPELALGAVILNGVVWGAARKSANVRALSRPQAIEHIRQGQPASHTEAVVINKIEPIFYGGPSNRRINMGLRLSSDALRAETHAAVGTLQGLAGDEVQLRTSEPVIILGSASPFIPLEAKESLRAEALATIGRTPNIMLAPSPLFVPSA